MGQSQTSDATGSTSGAGISGAGKHGPCVESEHASMLVKVFKSLAARDKESQLDKRTFLTYFNYPGVFGERIFALFDKERRGKICMKRFIDGVTYYLNCTTDEKLDILWKVYDQSGSNKVSYEEFCTMLYSLINIPSFIPGGVDLLKECKKKKEEEKRLLQDEYTSSQSHLSTSASTSSLASLSSTLSPNDLSSNNPDNLPKFEKSDSNQDESDKNSPPRTVTVSSSNENLVASPLSSPSTQPRRLQPSTTSLNSNQNQNNSAIAMHRRASLGLVPPQAVNHMYRTKSTTSTPSSSPPSVPLPLSGKNVPNNDTHLPHHSTHTSASSKDLESPRNGNGNSNGNGNGNGSNGGGSTNLHRTASSPQYGFLQSVGKVECQRKMVERIAQQAFGQCSLSPNDFLTFEQFKNWMSKSPSVLLSLDISFAKHMWTRPGLAPIAAPNGFNMEIDDVDEDFSPFDASFHSPSKKSAEGDGRAGGGGPASGVREGERVEGGEGGERECCPSKLPPSLQFCPYKYPEKLIEKRGVLLYQGTPLDCSGKGKLSNADSSNNIDGSSLSVLDGSLVSVNPQPSNSKKNPSTKSNSNNSSNNSSSKNNSSSNSNKSTDKNCDCGGPAKLLSANKITSSGDDGTRVNNNNNNTSQQIDNKGEMNDMKPPEERVYLLRRNFLYIYKLHSDGEEVKPCQIMFLEGLFVDPDDSRKEEGLYGLVIAAPNCKHLTYAKSAQDRDEWVRQLRVAAKTVPMAQYYDIGKQIGYGKFAKIYIATHKASGEEYAVKVIEKKNISDAETEALRAELAILKLVCHPNVICMKEVFESPTELQIIMPFLPGGDLYDKLTEVKHFDEHVTRNIIWQLLSALQYLHDRGIVHRDIKPENILLVHLDDYEQHIVIADFGLSQFATAKQTMDMTCGTLSYIAPEVLLCRGYNRAVDIWGVGIVAYLLLAGFLPFHGPSKAQLIDEILGKEVTFSNRVWKTISVEAKHLVTKLLTKDPTQRISLQDALKHPWFSLDLQNYGFTLGERRSSNPQQQPCNREKKGGAVSDSWGSHSNLMPLPTPSMMKLMMANSASHSSINNSSFFSDSPKKKDKDKGRFSSFSNVGGGKSSFTGSSTNVGEWKEPSRSNLKLKKAGFAAIPTSTTTSIISPTTVVSSQPLKTQRGHTLSPTSEILSNNLSKVVLTDSDKERSSIESSGSSSATSDLFVRSESSLFGTPHSAKSGGSQERSTVSSPLGTSPTSIYNQLEKKPANSIIPDQSWFPTKPAKQASPTNIAEDAEKKLQQHQQQQQQPVSRRRMSSSLSMDGSASLEWKEPPKSMGMQMWTNVAQHQRRLHLHQSSQPPSS